MSRTEVLPNNPALTDLAGRINTEHAACRSRREKMEDANLAQDLTPDMSKSEWEFRRDVGNLIVTYKNAIGIDKMCGVLEDTLCSYYEHCGSEKSDAVYPMSQHIAKRRYVLVQDFDDVGRRTVAESVPPEGAFQSNIWDLIVAYVDDLDIDEMRTALENIVFEYHRYVNQRRSRSPTKV